MSRLESKEKKKLSMQLATLCFLLDGDKVLLGMKKRRFAEGKWNGFGGKCEVGETVFDTAVRECREEADITLKSAEEVGILNCYHPGWGQQVRVYVVTKWEGNPVETEEMKPKWFSFDEVPYDQMWADEALWLPKILDGKKIKAELSFGENGDLLEHDIQLVEDDEVLDKLLVDR